MNPKTKRYFFLGSSALSCVVIGGLLIAYPNIGAVLVPLIVMGILLIALVYLLSGKLDPEMHRYIVLWTVGAYLFHLVLGEIIWGYSSLTTYFGGDAFTYNAGELHCTNTGIISDLCPPCLPARMGSFISSHPFIRYSESMRWQVSS